MEMAGTCRLVDLEGNPVPRPPKPPSLLHRAWAWIKARLPKRINPDDGSENSDDSDDYYDDDDDGIDYFLNAAGNLAYLDEEGKEVELSPEEVEELARIEKERESEELSQGISSLDDLSSVDDDDFDGDGLAPLPNEDIESGGRRASMAARKASVVGGGRRGSVAGDKGSGLLNRRASMRRRSSVGGMQGSPAQRKMSRMARRASIVSAALKVASDKLEKQLEDEENVLGQGGGFLSRKRKEEEERKEQLRLQKLEQKRLEEEGCTDWLEWKCIICKRANRRPRNVKPSFNTGFVVKGVYFKRTIVALQPTPRVPTCEGCGTPANYAPRLCNRQLIKEIEDPYLAFKNYPMPVPPIKRNEWLKRMDKLISFFIGQWNHPDSKQMPNDWRLSLYLSSRFPIQQRHEKRPDQYYEIGEIVECKLQMKDWSRARVTDVKKAHAYDIL